MNKTLLNIGHSRLGTSDLWSQDIVDGLKALGADVITSTILQSLSEPTTYVEIHTESTPKDSTLELFSVVLEQDCIAIFDTATGRGRLVGPKAEDWGPFNPRFFFTPNGPLASLQAPEHS